MLAHTTYLVFVCVVAAGIAIYTEKLLHTDRLMRRMRRHCAERLAEFAKDAAQPPKAVQDGMYYVLVDRKHDAIVHHASPETDELDQWNDGFEILRVASKIEAHSNPVVRPILDLTHGQALHAICKAQTDDHLCVVYMRI